MSWRGLPSRIKSWINAPLGRFNMQLGTLTAERREMRRMRELADSGYFDRPVFPLPRPIANMDCTEVFGALEEHSPRFADFSDPAANDVGFFFDNGYFSSPDAEVLYAMVRLHKPAKIVEVGCGNSTKLTRQAIIDGGLSTRVTCIDPSPRADIGRCADEIILQPVERLVDHDVFKLLADGDVLFIDSSHELRSGNDCVALFLRVLPALRARVLVHIHDVFLPYDYPQWFADVGLARSTEQYLVQTMLMADVDFDVLWASHYLIRSDNRLTRILPAASPRSGTSLWLRKR